MHCKTRRVLPVVFIALAASRLSAAEPNESENLADLRGIFAADFNQDGSRVIVRLRNGEIGLWNVGDGKRVPCELSSQTSAASQFMSADRSAVAIGFEKTTRIFDATSGKALSPVLDTRPSSWFGPGIFSPDPLMALTATRRGFCATRIES